MKLCKDCKHRRRDFPLFWMSSFARCSKITQLEASTGTHIKGFCTIERKSYGMCGKEAKYFESKQ